MEALQAPQYDRVRSPSQETKLCIVIDSNTPVIMKVPIAPKDITLGQFRAMASLQEDCYKFYFKSHDSEFGMVKEEIIDDQSPLPIDGNRIVAWVISNSRTQSNLSELEDSYDKVRASVVSSPTTSLARCSNMDLDLDQSIYQTIHPLDSTTIQVRLVLDHYNFLGLTLVGPSSVGGAIEDPGLYVGQIKPNSVVEQDGRIQIGDRIIEINGMDLRDIRNDDAIAMFRTCVDRRGPIDLVLQRSRSLSPVDKRGFELSLPTYLNKPAGNMTNRMIESPPYRDDLPIPTFGRDPTHFTFGRSEHRSSRGAHSLPRSITPRSLYGNNNYSNSLTNENPRLQSDSRSAYEPTTPTSMRLFETTLHSGRDDIHTIFTALRADPVGLDVKDREWLKVVVRQAFLGSALVKWLSKNVYGFGNRREIKQYANQMLTMGLIKSPMACKKFSEKCLYNLA